MECDLLAALDLLWERACSRRRFNIQQICRLLHRLREQARSRRGLCCQLLIRRTASTSQGAPCSTSLAVEPSNSARPCRP
ncbi:hypothetical protein EI534_02435 [Pseudomonas frederiksbergensis]|nr:hypothetical protein [Pseudomonas frederiksbergensis]